VAEVLQPADDGGVADRVAGELRRAIHVGTLAPGSRLVERSLARDLRTSHIPVREALARLTEEGLVEREPRRGARVATLTEAKLEELSSLRIVLERFVVRRAQERWSPAAESALRRRVDAMAAMADAGRADAVVDLDQAFHEDLWAIADHSLLLEVASGVRGRIVGFLRAATLPLPPDALRAHAESHVVLLDAVASGDPERAEREVERHVSLATARIRSVLLET